jgi:hypothetical protein
MRDILYGPQRRHNMPDEKTELDQYQKDKDEFSEAVDDVLGADESKSDEEIIAEMDKKQADGTDVGGEPKQDPDKPAVEKTDDATKTEDDNLDGQGIVPVTKDIEDPPDTIEAWKGKADSFEAELAKERQKTSSWNGRITAANTKVKELEAKIVELESQVNTAVDKDTKASNDSDNEVLDRFRKDFPELSNVVDIMQKRIDGVVPTAPAKVETPAADNSTTSAEVDDDKAVAKVKSDHVASIRKVHPDLPEAVNSGVLLTWINKQPTYIRPTLETIYKSGKAEDVIKMVTNFKDDTGWKSQLKQADDKNTSAQDKLDSMIAVQSETRTPNGKVVDKEDYDQGAKDAGL